MAEGKKVFACQLLIWILFKLKRKNYWDVFKWIKDKIEVVQNKYALFFYFVLI
jgi:hypothetical protein